MVKITLKSGSKEFELVAEVGETLLASIRKVFFIFGGCSGVGVCGGCHVYITSPEFVEKLGDISAEERDVLDALPNGQHNSRLACYIRISEELDGMTITIPEM